jgi:hypothetical protein
MPHGVVAPCLSHAAWRRGAVPVSCPIRHALRASGVSCRIRRAHARVRRRMPHSPCRVSQAPPRESKRLFCSSECIRASPACRATPPATRRPAASRHGTPAASPLATRVLLGRSGPCLASHAWRAMPGEPSCTITTPSWNHRTVEPASAHGFCARLLRTASLQAVHGGDVSWGGGRPVSLLHHALAPGALRPSRLPAHAVGGGAGLPLRRSILPRP